MRLVSATLWLTLLLLCAFHSDSFASAQHKGTLKGKIETEKGKPIVGADIRAMRNSDRTVKETKTDNSGVFSFELDPDDYTITIDVDGYESGTLNEMHQVEEGKETTLKTIRIKKTGKRTSLIRGAVFDINGGSLAGVNLKLVRVATAEEEKDHKKFDSLSMSYTANHRGEFAFRVPAERARYKVTATLSGFKPETKYVDVNENEAVPLAFSLEPVKK